MGYSDNIVIGFISIDTEANAKKLAKHLVESRLAACVSILPGIHSVYRWKDKIESATEVLLLVKTLAQNSKRLSEEVLHLHPYETPEVVFIDIADGLPEYLSWLKSCVEIK
ncbi:UNVERIFIED_CONTAM: hypothetical protein GTU68_011971 [Idotea baltica]|nr:hypothetical protein [Idotea baltica]